MRGRWLALGLLMLLGLLVGVLIAGVPSVSDEMRVTADVGDVDAVTSTTASSPSTTLPTARPASTEPVATEDLTAIVLNGAGVEGAAAELTERIEDAGYETMTPDNADRVDATVVYYRDEALAGEAETLAALVLEGAGAEHATEGAELPFSGHDDVDLIVVIGTDYEPPAESETAARDPRRPAPPPRRAATTPTTPTTGAPPASSSSSTTPTTAAPSSSPSTTADV